MMMLIVGLVVGYMIGIASYVNVMRKRKRKMVDSLNRRVADGHDASRRSPEYLTKLGIDVATQCWCHPLAEMSTLDTDVAMVFALKIGEYVNALRWCGGSGDFQADGNRRVGWNEIVEPLI
jgi:hypothetical protein